MTPPYNAQQKHCNEAYVSSWKATGSSKKKPTEDPSKGFHFVYEIAKQMFFGGEKKLAVLLPMQCAIGTSKEIQSFKEKMLQEHHLDAVFSFPDDIFHPGASACACCMVFDIGIKHEKAPIKETFFGYFKDDGFQKRKNLGRVEREGGIWKNEIEPLWLDLYRRRKEVTVLSVNKEFTAEDEWLSEAYIKTDYSTLSDKDFQETINNYLSFLVKMGMFMNLNDHNWTDFKISDIFPKIEYGKNSYAIDLEDGHDCIYVGAKKDENGFMKWCKRDDSLLSKGNCIVFIVDGKGSVGYCNYMDRDFIATANLKLGYCKELNQYSGMFIATITSRERFRYSFGRKWKKFVKDTIISLPSTINNDGKCVPDWKFMEEYIKSLHCKPITTKKETHLLTDINTQNCKEFKISNLFDVVLSKGDIKIDDVEKGDIPLVSSGETNNGIVGYISNDGDGKAEMFDGNLITVDMFCNAFYQK